VIRPITSGMACSQVEKRLPDPPALAEIHQWHPPGTPSKVPFQLPRFLPSRSVVDINYCSSGVPECHLVGNLSPAPMFAFL
jgi:hypothetical protein